MWKSPAAGNVQNLDWYLDIGYTTTGAGTFGLYPFEFYDPAAHLAYRGPFYAAHRQAHLDATYYSRCGATGYTLENFNLVHLAAATFSSGNYAHHDLDIPVTTIGYWASVSPKRVVLFTSNQPAMVLYAGLYEPLRGLRRSGRCPASIQWLRPGTTAG